MGPVRSNTRCKRESQPPKGTIRESETVADGREHCWEPIELLYLARRRSGARSTRRRMGKIGRANEYGAARSGTADTRPGRVAMDISSSLSRSLRSSRSLAVEGRS